METAALNYYDVIMQVLIGKTGKGSLKRRVAECSAENISLPVAERASVMLQQFDAITIQDTSLGCATFHAWVRKPTACTNSAVLSPVYFII